MARISQGGGVDYIMGKLEGIEEMLARQIKDADTDRREAKDHRSAVYKKLEEQELALAQVDARVQRLETAVHVMEPAISEVNEWRSRARAAGWLGRGLWVIGGFVLAAAAWLTAHLKGWFGVP